jgi:prophage regulatory protein
MNCCKTPPPPLYPFLTQVNLVAASKNLLAPLEGISLVDYTDWTKKNPAWTKKINFLEVAMGEKRVIRLDEVKKKTGLSRSNIYRRMKLGTFPRPFKLGNGARASGWWNHEVDGWLNDASGGTQM